MPPRPAAPRDIGFLIFPGFQLLDAAGPLAAFEMPARSMVPAPYRIHVIAAGSGLIRSSCGAIMQASRPANGQRFDTLIIAGGIGTREAMADLRTLALVRSLASHARRVCSVCSGAYILAEAGLLRAKRATTHWGRCKHFAAAYPDIKLEPDRIYIRDGRIWTSAGITAGIDLSLALIAQDLGEEVSRRAAQDLVVYHRRPGGQSQFSALLEIERAEGRFTELLAWMRERLSEPLTVDQLAEQAGMSPRNFARAFAAETGVTPAKAVERLRLEAAREQVERGHAPIEIIASDTGFHDPERMRRAFVRAFGQPPQALRRLARAA
jgi:transcriptional regulator GlxA family with amidase domain